MNRGGGGASGIWPILAIFATLIAGVVALDAVWRCDMTRSMRPRRGEHTLRRVSRDGSMGIYSVPDTIWEIPLAYR